MYQFKNNKNSKFLKLKKVIFSISDVGGRKKNEDYAYCGVNNILDNLLIVCDGVGSYKGSEIAAKIVGKTFINSFLKKEYLLDNDVFNWFEQNILIAKQQMQDHVLRFSEHFQMCTTIVLAISIKDNIYIFWIGDSRAYLLDKNGFEVLTNDHNLLNHLIALDYSVEEIENFGSNLHALTNCISINTFEKQKYDYLTLKIKKNTIIFLASDGFYNFFDDYENLYKTFTNGYNQKQVGIDLINTTLKNESNDNISFSYFGFLGN